MKNKKEYHIGEFLFRFFRKRSASFLANSYKAGITGSSKDIHRARLDVKKIFAILDLLQVVRPKNEKDPGYDRLFKKLYRASGRIREIQVNLLLLTRKEFSAYNMNPFLLDLMLQERDRTGEFLEAIRKFDEKELAWVEKRIKKEVYRITPPVLQKKANRYILAKTAMIADLAEKENEKPDLHKIRQHLKELSTILTLIFSVSPSRKFDQAITGLNKAEMLIGEWHDRMVLEDALETFLKKREPNAGDQLAQIAECHRMLLKSENMAIEIKQLIGQGLLVRNP